MAYRSYGSGLYGESTYMGLLLAEGVWTERVTGGRDWSAIAHHVGAWDESATPPRAYSEVDTEDTTWDEVTTPPRNWN